MPKIIDTSQAYALWAASYPPYPHNEFMQAEQDAMFGILPELRGKTAVDLGCGTGRYCLLAIHRGAEKIVGIDKSAEMLAANRRYSVDYEVIYGDMCNLPLASSSFEVVICGLVLGHLPSVNMRKCVIEINRVLKPFGEAVISDFHPLRYEAGGRRTLRLGEIEYHIEHYIHTLEDYISACADIELRLVSQKETFSKDLSNIPSALALKLRKIPF